MKVQANNGSTRLKTRFVPGLFVPRKTETRALPPSSWTTRNEGSENVPEDVIDAEWEEVLEASPFMQKIKKYWMIMWSGKTKYHSLNYYG